MHDIELPQLTLYKHAYITTCVVYRENTSILFEYYSLL